MSVWAWMGLGVIYVIGIFLSVLACVPQELPGNHDVFAERSLPTRIPIVRILFWPALLVAGLIAWPFRVLYREWRGETDV